ncbi:prolyl 4-hydroxylase [Seminavis robusta]|uniref:Prolyl 4-hydroxylase n=1 Tax=Seminavis robusta TaxID=568900 RepID=A0A9N8F4L4_9STRA|nr:prolyl 4-hydroxylase [Seminavis robusta]|eukprot:Sro3547_g349140.1 prolyl 4-hydroxylase (421) ;mRNA; r:938-2200
MVASLLLLLLVLLVSIPAASGRKTTTGGDGRDIQVINDSNAKVDIFWVHPTTRKLHKSIEDGILKGTDAVINSFKHHEFEVQEVPRKSTGSCRESECAKAHFKVTTKDEQRFIIAADFTVTYQDTQTRALEQAKRVSRECPVPTTLLEDDNNNSTMDEWTACLQREIEATLREPRQEVHFQASVRHDLGQRLVKHACQDQERFPTSISTHNQTLLNLGPGKNPTMRVFFDSNDNHKVVLLERFVSKAQCQSLLQDVSNTDGTTLDWAASQKDATVSAILSRIYQSLNRVLDHKVPISEKAYWKHQKQKQTTTHFQIQTRTPSPDDEPHEFVAPPNLLGTIILFCQVPTKGGAIHFPKAGTHIKPYKGSALWITYQEPNNNDNNKQLLDDKNVFTNQYVQCPVVEGTETTLTLHLPMISDT